MRPPTTARDGAQIVKLLRDWSRELGFSRLDVSRADLGEDADLMQAWVERGWHADMDYLQRNAELRRHPQQLVPNTLSVISVALPYWPEAAPAREVLKQPQTAYISRYALGRDYHKSVRGRLRSLARRLQDEIGPFGYRAFADSAPILEKALARDASLGWIGKHSLLIDPQRGSWFFLGELYTDLPLPASDAAAVTNACGACQACLRACPTNAIIGDGQIDARRCISYLTIENKGPIPLQFRRAIGNRIFGCDDCQLVCPWNRQADTVSDPDFTVRHGLDAAPLHELMQWSEAQFLRYTEGMPLRRCGYLGWLRNLAVALGNGPTSPQAIAALKAHLDHPSDMLREHLQWALDQLQTRGRPD